MQEGEQEKYLKVVSTGKHFADYDQEGNGGTDRGAFNAVVNDQDQVGLADSHRLRAHARRTRIVFSS